MNADGFIRACEKNGDLITIKRLTGTRQVAFSVVCLATVERGAVSDLVGNTVQTADRVKVSDREMNEAQWPKPPRHGDQISYADGSTRTVVGPAQPDYLEDDIVYTLKTLGG